MIDDVLNATVIYRQDLTPELAVVRIKPDSGEVTPFEPGQFCTIGLPKTEPPTEAELAMPTRRGPRLVRRPYSIASSADEHGYYELYVVLVKEGRLTPRIWPLHEGDRLWLDPKVEGHFSLKGISPDKDLVMLATGTGLAPFMSMLRTYGPRNEKRWHRFVVIHGTRLACDLAYKEELERASYDDPSVFYIPIVTREPLGSEWKGMRGRVHAVMVPEIYEKLIGAPLSPHHCHVLLCGNPEMIKEAEKTLHRQGFVTETKHTAGNIRFERYW